MVAAAAWRRRNEASIEENQSAAKRRNLGNQRTVCCSQTRTASPPRTLSRCCVLLRRALCTAAHARVRYRANIAIAFARWVQQHNVGGIALAYRHGIAQTFMALRTAATRRVGGASRHPAPSAVFKQPAYRAASATNGDSARHNDVWRNGIASQHSRRRGGIMDIRVRT
jgi:hypothetical protein